MNKTSLNSIQIGRSISSYSKVRNLYSNFIRCKHLQIKNHILEFLLKNQGFINVKKETFRQGKQQNLLVDAEHRAY